MKFEKPISTYISFLAVTIVALLVIKSFDISYPLTVTNVTRSGELAVVGEGKVDVIPDAASIEVGITVNNVPTVEDAQKSINTVNNEIIAAMKILGIDQADIRTSNYSISPSYSYEPNQNRINGYNGNVNLSIKAKDVKLISRVVEEATKAGANQVYGTNFIVEKPEKYREEARNRAITNAKEQAQKLAQTLGIRLGRVVNIVESAPSQIGPPFPMESYALKGGAGGAPRPDIEPGSQTITSVVTLYFEKR